MNWIPYEKQKPTRKDANSDGDVLWLYALGGHPDTSLVEPMSWNEDWDDAYENIWWLRIPDYPGAKSKDEQGLSEFELWWFEESGLTGDTESRQAAEKAWTAARKKR